MITGCLVCRFQGLHKGHMYLIEEALKRCDRLLILIGSAQEERTSKNPFSFLERKAMLTDALMSTDQNRERLLNNSIHILPLDDIGVGDNPRWGEYVLEYATNHGGKPDVMFSGEESCRLSWYTGLDIKEIFIPKLKSGDIISATRVRNALLKDDKEEFDSITPISIHYVYNYLLKVVKNSNLKGVKNG